MHTTTSNADHRGRLADLAHKLGKDVETAKGAKRVEFIADRDSAPRKVSAHFLKSDTTAVAYVNGGRLVADCVCRGAEIVEPGHDLLCGSCGMVSKVDYPTAKEMAEVDEVLAARPVSNRNWRPGETIAMLEAENIDHGIKPRRRG